MTRQALIEELGRHPADIAAQETLVFQRACDVKQAAALLSRVEADLLLQGKDGPITGTNEATRKSQLVEMTLAERDALDEAQNELTRASIHLRFLQNEFSAARSLARLIAGGGE